MSERQDKVAELVREHAAAFIQRESNGTSLISVTRATVSPDLKQGTIYITCLPTSGEESALNFFKRKRSELRDFLKDHMTQRSIPFVDIEIDVGEKHRQKIDDLLREDTH
jgi:ribosome-binding factor A